MSVVFVIKLQLSKISVKTSKGHKYFEEFTLWILIKHILIFNIHSRIKSFFPASLINWAGYAQHIFESNMYGHFIPIDILPYGHFQIHQIFMDISLLWTICHMVFLHIDHYKDWILKKQTKVYSRSLIENISEFSFILSSAFTLFIRIMISPKNFGKIAILKIWSLVFFWGVKNYFGILPLKWCIFRHEKKYFNH